MYAALYMNQVMAHHRIFTFYGHAVRLLHIHVYYNSIYMQVQCAAPAPAHE